MGGFVSKCCGAVVRDGDTTCYECGDSLNKEVSPEVDAILNQLNPDDRAKLEKAMAEMAARPPEQVPQAKATGELRLWRDDGDLIGVPLDREDVWLLLYALEQVQESGPFDAVSYAQRYESLTKKVFEAYR